MLHQTKTIENTSEFELFAFLTVRFIYFRILLHFVLLLYLKMLHFIALFQVCCLTFSLLHWIVLLHCVPFIAPFYGLPVYCCMSTMVSFFNCLPL